MKRCWTAKMSLVLALLAAGVAQANNLLIDNTTVLLSETQDGTARVSFDISWENSWRMDTDDYPGYFHDAAWVFFKVRPVGATEWTHVKLNTAGTNPAGNDPGTAGANLELVVPSDRMGVFVRRSAANQGAGTLASTNLTLRWHITDSGVASSQTIEMKAFGLEMVYVAEGEFWYGDTHTPAANNAIPQTLINTPTATTVPALVGDYYAGGYPVGGTLPASAAWPNGYNAFYMMKYPVTQGQYTDFLNLLTYMQATNRLVPEVTTLLALSRNAVTNSWPNYIPVAATRGFLIRFEDGTAFSDWSGLRPFTEMEYEKACRGPLPPVGNEFAWGTTNIVYRTSIVGVEGSGTETYLPAGANCHLINFYGLRAGIFAGPGATREEGGASYWGIMELTGNAYERAIAQTLTTFLGNHGDGVLTALAEADVATWPPITASNRAVGAGYRGGPVSVLRRLMVSDRVYMAAGASYGMGTLFPSYRAARTAP